MAMKIAVCDDEVQTLQQIEAYLNQIMIESGCNFETYYFSSGKELLQDMPRDVSLLLLDIRMKDINGLQAARKLREEGCKFYLFFITSNTQYALEGYEVQAYAFLRKPVGYSCLKKNFLDVCERLYGEQSYRFEVKTDESSEIVDSGEIIYIEVYGHTSILVLEQGRKISTKISLDQLEAKLCRRGFFRCHKSYLINLNKVQSIRRASALVSNGDEITISRKKKDAFLIAINHTLSG